MAKPTLSPIQKRDIILLTYLVQHEVKDGVLKFKKTPGALNSELYRIRERIARCERYLKEVRHLRHISNRINKLTSSGQIVRELRFAEDDAFE